MAQEDQDKPEAQLARHARKLGDESLDKALEFAERSGPPSAQHALKEAGAYFAAAAELERRAAQ
jgi:hypothetical protein